MDFLKKEQKNTVKEEPLKTEPSWWSQRSPLERVGVISLATVASVGIVVVLFPGAVSTFIGGGMVASGSKLVLDNLKVR